MRRICESDFAHHRSRSVRWRRSVEPSDNTPECRRGVVVVELIIWLPVLMIFLLAVIEFAILLQVEHSVSYASRLGARIASEASRSTGDNPNLSNLNSPSAVPPPPVGESLKEQVDRLLVSMGQTDSCQVILEHNATGITGGVQRNPDPAPSHCNCGSSSKSLPAGGEYVRVTVCLPCSGNVPNLLSTFGLDLSASTITHSTVFRYEPCAAGNTWAVGLNASTLGHLILNETGTGPNWNPQTSAFGGLGTLNGVDFVDASTGWAVGAVVNPLNPTENFPAIIRTLDGGLTWSAQTSPFALGVLTDVDFVDANSGWAVGTDATSTAPQILHTSDGGATWAVQPTPVATGEVVTVDFVDATTGYAVGTEGMLPLVLKTIDGGSNWSTVSPAVPGGTGTALDFLSPSVGWITGSVASDPFIRQTINGGASYTVQAEPVTEGLLTSVDFVDANRGWAVGQEVHPMNPLETLTVILGTTNGGATWTRQTHPVSIGGLTDVDFVDAMTGYAVGTDETGLTVSPYILKTEDGGMTWAIQAPTVTDGTLLDVSAAPQADE